MVQDHTSGQHGSVGIATFARDRLERRHAVMSFRLCTKDNEQANKQTNVIECTENVA
jgi:hypothetical protein